MPKPVIAKGINETNYIQIIYLHCYQSIDNTVNIIGSCSMRKKW